MFLGLDSATMCAQVIVLIPYPTEPTAENHPGLVSDAVSGWGRQAVPSAAGCLPGARHCALGKLSQVYLLPLSCISYSAVSNSATTYRNLEYKMPFKIVWVLILQWFPASGKTKRESEP